MRWPDIGMVLGAALGVGVGVAADGRTAPDHRIAAFLDGFQGAGRHFEQNLGQLPSSAAFAYRTEDYRFDVIEDGMHLQLEGNRMMLGDPMQIRFRGCNVGGAIEGVDKLPFTLMYRLPVDGVRRRMTSVPAFAQVACQGVYDGIDLRYRITGGQVEYDFLVQPGADPSRIQIAVTGAREIGTTPDGNVKMSFPICDVIQHRPVAYQDIDGVRHRVSAAYALQEDHVIRIVLGPYESAAPLVIDPILSVIPRF